MKRYGLLAVGFSAGLLFLTGCQKKEKMKLEGVREEIRLAQIETLTADASEKVPVLLPAESVQETWENPGGGAGIRWAHHKLEKNLALKWTYNAGAGGQDSRVLTLPVCDGESLYVLNGQSQVIKINRKTGKEAWTKAITDDGRTRSTLGGGLCIDDHGAFVGTALGEAVCLNKDNGVVKWRQSLPAPSRGQPFSADGKVFFVTVTNHLLAFDAATGKMLWNHAGILESTSLLGTGSVQMSMGNVVVPYTSGEVFALDQNTGQATWVQNLSSLNSINEMQRLSQVRAQPLIGEDNIYLTSNGGIVMAVNRESGHIAWQRQFGSAHTPAQGSNMIFLVTTDEKLVAVEKGTGKIKWIRPLVHPTMTEFDEALEDLEKMDVKKEKVATLTWSGPLLAGGYLLVFSSDGLLHFCNPITGRTQNILKMPAGFPLGGIVVDETLYVATQTGQIYAYGAAPDAKK